MIVLSCHVMSCHVMSCHVCSIDRCSIERVVSGPGIRRLYEFLCKQNPKQVSAAVTEALRVAEDQKEDQSAVIARFALADEPDDLCLQTLNTFISSYGAEAGNMALKTIPYGGMYIAGGIGPKVCLISPHRPTADLITRC